MVCFLYGWLIEPNWIEVRPLQLTLPHLTSAFNGFKIVQISDIHVSRYMTKKRLDKIVTLINQQNPDIVAITGDFDSQFSPFKPKLLREELTKINSQSINLAVLGNHDHAQHKEVGVRAALAKSHLLELNNNVYTIDRKGEKLNFAGIDDPYFGHPNLNQVLQQLPEKGAAIALVHEPDFADRLAQTKRFDLQLSGHSHGGQVIFPWVGPLVLPIDSKKHLENYFKTPESKPNLIIVYIKVNNAYELCRWLHKKHSSSKVILTTDFQTGYSSVIRRWAVNQGLTTLRL